MRVPRRLLTGLLPGLFLVFAAPLAAEEPAWRDATRDIFVDGRLDKTAQALVSGPRTAIVSPLLEEAFLLDRETKAFQVVPRAAIRFAADRATATLDTAATPEEGGPFQKVDSSGRIFAWKGHSVLVARHQGLVGDVTEAALFEAVPVWKGLLESYTPSAAAVESLRKFKQPATMTLVFGTWCGDSKDYVPKVLKTLRAAGNPRLSVRLVALDNQFLQPADVIRARRIINVPTILVERRGREIGRVTETPAAATVEEDLAAILRGKPNEHRGRYERGAELASGTYLYRDAAGERGTERWTLYETKDGGRLVHSRIVVGDLATEVFHGTDASGKLDFSEITKRQGEGVTRARFWLDGETLSGRLRGKEAGILQQDLVVPASFAFASPAVAAAGWMGAAARQASYSDLVCYVAPESFESPLGSTCVVTYRAAGEESVRVPAGEFRAKRLSRQSPSEASDWWLHADLGIPVRGQIVGGLEYVLTSLEAKPPKKES